MIIGTRRKMGRRKAISRPKLTKGVQNGTKVFIADNSGAKIAQIINVDGYKGRQRRLPKGAVGSLLSVTVKRGKPELRGNVLKAVLVRQKKIFRRPDGTRLCFEDNAAVLVTKEGDPKGTEQSFYRYPVIQ